MIMEVIFLGVALVSIYFILIILSFKKCNHEWHKNYTMEHYNGIGKTIAVDEYFICKKCLKVKKVSYD